MSRQESKDSLRKQQVLALIAEQRVVATHRVRCSTKQGPSVLEQLQRVCLGHFLQRRNLVGDETLGICLYPCAQAVQWQPLKQV